MDKTVKNKCDSNIREFIALMQSMGKTEQEGLYLLTEGLRLLANKKAAV